MVNNGKKKLIVLGGGVGSLSSVFEITNDPDWREKFESITVYQMGWRLGGKGASGRRPPYGRIEEHGLHVWMGFYNNSFDIIQRAYAEMARPAGSPLATWQDAFKEHSYVVMAQLFQEKWYPWAFDFPKNDKIPGKGSPMPTLWELIGCVLKWIEQIYKDSETQTQPEVHTTSTEHQNALARIEGYVRREMIKVEIGLASLAHDILTLIRHKYEKLDTNVVNHTPSDHEMIIYLLEDLKKWIVRELLPKTETELKILQLVILMDTGLAMVLGLLKDGILFHPQKLDSIDGEDLRQWMTRHDALTISVESPLMKGLYDLVFAYRDGKLGIENADFAAGTAIRCILRILATYKGSVFWKMQAGMGDTVFTPLHQALQKRGVDFKFFQKVKNLGLSADGKSISTLLIGRQATVIAGETSYDPYVNVQNLDCWPSDPNYDQLIEGSELQKQNINLESFYTTWKDQDYILEAGKDFDEVIFGISVGSIPYLCQELIASSSAWQKMVSNILTVRTMAFQTWMNKDLTELGWEGQSPVMDGFVDPMNTWADMSQLIPREGWPVAANILNISYFCGPMEGGIPPATETQTPQIALDAVTQVSKIYLDDDADVWWPKDTDGKNKFNQSSVVDIYYRANIDPSERYVLSVKGSTPFRIYGGRSGFDNLYLAGDWTYNGLNAGCVEACTMSGKIVSNALTGLPLLTDIDGWEEK
jgi:uncharacterized protein with NAD-binding domain and iron-sulfur cluster